MSKDKQTRIHLEAHKHRKKEENSACALVVSCHVIAWVNRGAARRRCHLLVAHERVNLVHDWGV